MDKFIENIIEEHYPAKKAPKWVNYKLFKAKMIKNLKESLEDSQKHDLKELDISSILFGYISENIDEGSSAMKNAVEDESYVPIKDLKKEDDLGEAKDYDSLKVVELKELLKQKGLTTTGKKVDLIKRLKGEGPKSKKTTKKTTKPRGRKPKKTKTVTKKTNKTKNT